MFESFWIFICAYRTTINEIDTSGHEAWYIQYFLSIRLQVNEENVNDGVEQEFQLCKAKVGRDGEGLVKV